MKGLNKEFLRMNSGNMGSRVALYRANLRSMAKGFYNILHGKNTGSEPEDGSLVTNVSLQLKQDGLHHPRRECMSHFVSQLYERDSLSLGGCNAV